MRFPARLWAGLLVLLAFAMGGCSSTPPGAPPLLCRDTSLAGATRTRGLGPFFERQEATNGTSVVSWRPFFSHVKAPADGTQSLELLWPLATFRTTRGRSRWRVLTAYGRDDDLNDDGSVERTNVFPLFFSGKNEEGKPYWALFPLLGRIDGFLSLDRFSFFLFPLFGKAVKDDIRSTYLLWPLISWATGDTVSRFRVFPFYGYSRSGDDWVKRFVLWPFWTSVTYGGERHPHGGGFILWPLFGRVKLEDQVTTMVFPPFCRFSRNDRGYKLRRIWPFYEYERNGEYGRTFFWPLWGRRYWPNRVRTFLLWPFIMTDRVTRADQEWRKVAIFPFWSSERTLALDAEADDGSSVKARHLALWPLFAYDRSEAGDSAFRFLNLWPIRRWEPVKRNLQPLWTLYQRQQVAGTVEHELLWGWFKSRKTPAGGRYSHLFPFYSYEKSDAEANMHRWSLLGGLAGRKRMGHAVQWRWLWVFKAGDDLKGEE